MSVNATRNYQNLGSFTLGASGSGTNTKIVDLDLLDIYNLQLFVTVESTDPGVQLVMKEAASPIVEGKDDGFWFKIGGFTTPTTNDYDSTGEPKTLNTTAASGQTVVVTKIDIVENEVGRFLRLEFTNTKVTSRTVSLEAYI